MYYLLYSDANNPHIQFSITNLIDDNGANYGVGVYLDTKLFDNIPRSKWKATVANFITNTMAGSPLTMYAADGSTETVRIAKKGEKVRKQNTNGTLGKSHPVITDLAWTNNRPIQQKAVAHAAELVKASGREYFRNENSHGWLDANGWTLRSAYIMEPNGNIYEAVLNIARSQTGDILYRINKIKRIGHGQRPAVLNKTGQSISTNSINRIISDVNGKSNTIEDTLDNNYLAAVT